MNFIDAYLGSLEKNDIWEHFSDLIQRRWSCRKLLSGTVTDEDLKKILEAAQIAPSACNKQPFKIFVAKSKSAVSMMKDCIYGQDFGADCFLAVGAKSEDGYRRARDGKYFAAVDAVIAATHMMLAIQALGLGTTWLGAFDPDALVRFFPSMTDYDIVGVFPIGKPATPEASMSHFHRKKLELLSEIL